MCRHLTCTQWLTTHMHAGNGPQYVQAAARHVINTKPQDLAKPIQYQSKGCIIKYLNFCCSIIIVNGIQFSQ